MVNTLPLRVKHTDIAKGVSIVLVAMNHSKISEFLPTLIEALGLLRMPLFFFLAGIFISPNNTIIDSVVRKGRALLQPYFVTLLSLSIVHVFLPLNNVRFEDEIAGIFYGVGDTISWTSLWFLPHLFVLASVGFVIIKSFKFEQRTASEKMVFFICLISLNYFTSQYISLLEFSLVGVEEPIRGLPFSIDLLPFSLIFFLGGYVSKNLVVDFKLSWQSLCFALASFLAICLCTTADINLN